MSPEMIELFLRSLGKEKVEEVGFEHDYYTVGVLLLEFIQTAKIMYFSASDFETPEGMLKLKAYQLRRQQTPYSVNPKLLI